MKDNNKNFKSILANIFKNNTIRKSNSLLLTILKDQKFAYTDNKDYYFLLYKGVDIDEYKKAIKNNKYTHLELNKFKINVKNNHIVIEAIDYRFLNLPNEVICNVQYKNLLKSYSILKNLKSYLKLNYSKYKNYDKLITLNDNFKIPKTLEIDNILLSDNNKKSKNNSICKQMPTSSKKINNQHELNAELNRNLFGNELLFSSKKIKKEFLDDNFYTFTNEDYYESKRYNFIDPSKINISKKLFIS